MPIECSPLPSKSAKEKCTRRFSLPTSDPNAHIFHLLMPLRGLQSWQLSALDYVEKGMSYKIPVLTFL